MTRDEKEMMREIAEHAAECAVRRILTALGVDITKPHDVQRDFVHLRNWRLACESAKAVGLRTLVGIIVTGLVGAIIMAFRGHS